MNALILVDIQNDFLPGGALAVPAGDEVIAVANKLQPAFDVVVATQDWHPADHQSFASNHQGKKVGEVVDLDGLDQVLWPDHCVQGSPGAEFAETLQRELVSEVFTKGTDVSVDSYSGFFDNGQRKATGMADYLRQLGVTEVYVMGLATDYCVKATALDAKQLGFVTFLVEDGCRGVELSPGDVEAAKKAMIDAGVQISHSRAVLAARDPF